MSGDARALLAEADRERRTADAVESLQRAVRLGRQLAVRRGLFGRRWERDDFRYLTGAESEALYRAASIVRRDSLARAAELESRVTTDGGAR